MAVPIRAHHTIKAPSRFTPANAWRAAFIGAAALVFALAVIAAVTAGAQPDPTVARSSATRVIDIAVLVFREGLESILVLTAITASMRSNLAQHRKPIGLGAAFGLAASLATWLLVVQIVDALTDSLPALQVQAATGLIAIVVLLVVMNWFFHKVYWTGWIGLHTQKKQELVAGAASQAISAQKVLLGLALLGFTSVYREGFEIVLFLQSYRLALGSRAIAEGVTVGLAFTAAVAVLTFVANRRLPYKKMLIITGAMLGMVLLVMVGEQAQEMQLAHWLPTTTLPGVARIIPAWAELWLAVFPTLESIIAQAAAAAIVLGSYALARRTR